MIANLAITDFNKFETISTCRFAQRVAMVTNDARRNETLDDKALIKRLRARIVELQAELAITKQLTPATGNGKSLLGSGPDRKECGRIMQEYISGRSNDPLASLPAQSLRICFELLRDIIRAHQARIGDLQVAVSEGAKMADQWL